MFLEAGGARGPILRDSERNRFGKKMTRWADLIRVALSNTSATAAVEDRVWSADERKLPAVKNYFTRGRYANDLMRLDDLIRAECEHEVLVARGGNPVENPMYQRSRNGRDNLRTDWARDLALVQRLMVAAHVSLEQIRDDLEASEACKPALDLVTNFGVGNMFQTVPGKNGTRTGFSIRTQLAQGGGKVYESLAYVSEGTIYVTRAQRMEDFDKDSPDERRIENRPWRQPEMEDWLSLDESAVRFAGGWLVSVNGEMGDLYKPSAESAVSWVDTETYPETLGARFFPDHNAKPITERSGPKSLLAVSLSGVESVMVSMFLLLVAVMTTTYTSDGWGIARFFLLLVALVGTGWVVWRIGRMLVDSYIGTDYASLIDKPIPRLWSLSQFARVITTYTATAIMTVAVAISTGTIEDKPLSDQSLWTSVTGVSPMLLIGFWLVVGKHVGTAIHLNPISEEQWRLSRCVDIAMGLPMIVAGISLNVIYQDQLPTLGALLLIYVLGALLARRAGNGLSAILSPLRVLERCRYRLFCYSDRGMDRQEFEALTEREDD